MQGDIRFTECRTTPGIKRGVPLLVLVTETHNGDITGLDQVPGTDRVDLRRLMVASEAICFRPQTIARRITGLMVGHGRGKHHGQIIALRALPDLVAPVGVYLA